MPPVERTGGSSSVVDVLDRVLDKGIVIDALIRVSVVGLDLLTVQARVVVASIATYLECAPAFGAADSVAPLTDTRPAHPRARALPPTPGPRPISVRRAK